jgi:arylsulfatase A-like enzyme
MIRIPLALLLLWISCRAAHADGPPAAPAPGKKMNVLFIAVDDLRDWVGFLGYKQVKTPNLDKLAARGVSFTRNYCAAPVCNPSRTALLTGLRPGATGVYHNGNPWQEIVPANVPTLPGYFRSFGFYVAGAGKIFHNGGANLRQGDWHDYALRGVPGEPDEEGDKKAKGKVKKEDTDGVGGIRWQVLSGKDADMEDYRIVDYCLRQLAKKHDRPFFLACGLHKPHMPWAVPKKYFDMYPLEAIQLPPVKENALANIPPVGVKMAKAQGDHAAILKSGRWKEAVQAYLAAITFCDAMIGRLLEGLDRSDYADNTIIVLWSDHGWHLGEKEHWRKFALWEEATRSPLIYVVPGLTKAGSVCRRTVDYMATYPTLCDLCGLPIPKHVQGESIKPLLADPAAAWAKPAVTTYLYQNHAVRSERWRYIRYVDGGEELYDHDADPHEWTNLAADARFAGVKKDLARWLPAENKLDPNRKKDR